MNRVRMKHRWREKSRSQGLRSFYRLGKLCGLREGKTVNVSESLTVDPADFTDYSPLCEPKENRWNCCLSSQGISQT
jgi:hypothetical protein